MNSFPSLARRASGLLIFVLLAALSATPRAGAAEIKDPEALCVMTFNLRYASDRAPNAWPQRRPVMKDCVKEVGPDLIGTQEGLYPQLKDFAADHPEYDWIGLGREGGSKGEFMAIFYRKDRFEPLEFDHFWLSDTPAVISSSTWGNSNRRMVTWARFMDRKKDKQFYFFNTHLDHEIQDARFKGATLIRQRIEGLNTTLPVILAGDFNAKAGENPAYDVLVNDTCMSDTWTKAAERRGDVVYTFHNFRGPTAGDNRIDWILSRGPVQCLASQIITCGKDGQYPSDHFPVVAWVKLGAPSP